MNKLTEDAQIEMMRIGTQGNEDYQETQEERISNNKGASKIFSDARQAAKRTQCILCGANCSGFCNSHSIPRFTLERIARKGYVSSPLRGELRLFNGPEVGLGKAGTFHIICNKCDSEVFRDYECETPYSAPPTDKMLSQIALKNYLHIISKREIERETYRIAGDQFRYGKDYSDEKQSIGDHDLKEYLSCLAYCKKSVKSGNNDHFYLCFFKKLNYVVPYAVQSAVTMVSDFEDGTINDVYNFDDHYVDKDIHIVVFPLKTTSAVFMFIKEGEKRYRRFYRQLSKLPEQDQLAAINYIIFSYTEDVFVAPQVFETIKDDKAFMDVCRKTTDYCALVPFGCRDLLNTKEFSKAKLAQAKMEFSLSKRNEIPNLLGQDFALSSLL